MAWMYKTVNAVAVVLGFLAIGLAAWKFGKWGGIVAGLLYCCLWLRDWFIVTFLDITFTPGIEQTSARIDDRLAVLERQVERLEERIE